MKYCKLLVVYCLIFSAVYAQEHTKVASAFSLNASYHIDNSWPTGYQVTVTLSNNTSSATTSWTSTFSLGQGQSISSLWNGVSQSNGQTITVTNPTWTGGGVVPAHGSTTFGFIVSNPQSTTPVINNLQATANGGSPTQPIPGAPTLNAITVNATNPSTFTVSWNSVANATSYTLQRDITNKFSNPVTVAQGATTSQTFTNQANGTYFFRVSASDAAGTSSFSNIQSVTVSGSTPPPPSSGPLIESYWESWNSADPLNDIVNMHVDVINIAFGNFTTTGAHTFVVAGLDASAATITQFVTLAHNAGKKVKISIGGATYPIAPQLQTTQDAVGMAQAIAQYVQQNNLDGVDFDIEDYPAPALQIALIQNTRQLLGSNALISYTPKSPASTTYPYDQVIQGAYQYLTDIAIMAYDYAPGYNYQQDVSALIAMGVPASKINVGLMPGMDDVGVTTSLADITAAAQYIKQNGLEGIMFWDLNRDFENATGLGVDAATNAAWNVFHG
jgi:hypothetical protein